jgi:transcriptional regulator with GAF, ATPase, and Fis domain
MRNDLDAALARCEEARALAKSLSQSTAEAELLGACLSGLATEPAAPPPGVADDVAVLALLGAPPDGFDAKRGVALARDLESRGRDDRAARVWLAVAARADEEPALEAAERAAVLLQSSCAGLSTSEAANFRRHLLGVHDPFPEDLERSQSVIPEDEEIEMEVLSLLEINHRLVAQEDQSTLLGEIVESALAVTGAERGFLVLEEAGELRFDTALDSCRGDIDAPELEVSRSVVAEALQRMEPVLVSNAQDDPLLASAPSVVSLDLRSILCVPFQVEGDLRGAIYADHRVREGAFTTRGARLLTLLADQAALAIRQVRRLGEIRRLNRALRGEVEAKESDLRTAQRVLEDAGISRSPSGLVGTSQAMRAVHGIVERAAKSDLPALVVGESGTGKELAARGLHELSPRASGPFVGENCAALPESLIESELFGYKRGAFTGADEDRPGMFERASGGSLFLDEIGEMPLSLQAKLLRVLETGEVRRLGDNEARDVDFRLVAATNRDLEEEVREGRFRADLFYRLDGLRVEMPPLRERPEDIPELVDHFLRLEATRDGECREIARPVLSRLCLRAWPGNVRELANEVARLCVVSDGDIVDPDLVREPGTIARESRTGPVRPLNELERDAILEALAQTGGDKGEAAKLLGISRSKIYQRLKEWDVGEEAGA